MLISITICLHNSIKNIEETLNSVFAQTYGNFEVILVDDGSTDGTAEFIESRFKDKRIILIRQSQHGLGHARNTSLSHAKGDWIAILDHDDVWEPQKLEKQIEVVKNNKNIDLVYCDCDYISETGKIIDKLSNYHDYGTINIENGNVLCKLLIYRCFINISTAMIKRDAVQRAGGFNPEYRYVEDYDLWLRLAGERNFYFINERLSAWRVHDSQFTKSNPEVALREQADLLAPYLEQSKSDAQVYAAINNLLCDEHIRCAELFFSKGEFRNAIKTTLGAFRISREQFFLQLRLKLKNKKIPPIKCIPHEWPRTGESSKANGINSPGSVPRPRLNKTKTRILIDASPLGVFNTGHYNFILGFIRNLAKKKTREREIYVFASSKGKKTLKNELGGDYRSLKIKRSFSFSSLFNNIYRGIANWHFNLLTVLAINLGVVFGVYASSERVLIACAGLGVFQILFLLTEFHAKVLRVTGKPGYESVTRTMLSILGRQFEKPKCVGNNTKTVEFIVWLGKFKYMDSTKVVFVPDLTTIILPETHTTENVQWYNEFLEYSVRYGNLIATLSESSKRDIVKFLKVRDDNVFVTPPNVNPIFSKGEYNQDFLHVYGIDSPYLLALGTIEPRKNLRRLVDAFDSIVNRPGMGDVVLVIAGPQGWDADFVRFLAEKDSSHKILKTGFVETAHLPSLYHYAKGVIYPSLYEGFGLPVLEAMLCSSVVLTSRSSSFPEVLGPGGIYFSPYSTNEIAGAIERVLGFDPAEEQRYREYCRERAETLQKEWETQNPFPGFE